MKKSVAVLAAGALVLPASAAAHVSVVDPEAPAEGYAFLDFAVPHGCDDSGTTEVRVQVPEEVPIALPEPEAGWNLETKSGPKEETEVFGETITEGVSEVIWSTDTPLPSDYVQRFTIEARMPAGEEGDVLYFPTVQTCEEGKTAWVQTPAEGETSEDLDEPAPEVVLTAPEGGYGSSHADDHEEGEEADDRHEADVKDDGDGMQVAALVLGGLGFLFGSASLVRARK